MIYLTQTRLMLESENAVVHHASSGEEIPQRVCRQLLANTPRYSRWHADHESQMLRVAAARRRERQILKLRLVAVEQVHRAALVRYLRDNRIQGAARDRTLREFHGMMDVRDSTLAEHQQYLLAASTQYCANDILDLVGDRNGLELTRTYELAYGQYFKMFCEKERARQNGRPYFLASVMPEVRGVAERLRHKILDAGLLPTRSMFSRKAPPAAAPVRGKSTVRTAAKRSRESAPRGLI